MGLGLKAKFLKGKLSGDKDGKMFPIIDRPTPVMDIIKKKEFRKKE